MANAVLPKFLTPLGLNIEATETLHNQQLRLYSLNYKGVCIGRPNSDSKFIAIEDTSLNANNKIAQILGTLNPPMHEFVLFNTDNTEAAAHYIQDTKNLSHSFAIIKESINGSFFSKVQQHFHRMVNLISVLALAIIGRVRGEEEANKISLLELCKFIYQGSRIAVNVGQPSDNQPDDGDDLVNRAPIEDPPVEPLTDPELIFSILYHNYEVALNAEGFIPGDQNSEKDLEDLYSSLQGFIERFPDYSLRMPTRRRKPVYLPKTEALSTDLQRLLRLVGIAKRGNNTQLKEAYDNLARFLYCNPQYIPQYFNIKGLDMEIKSIIRQRLVRLDKGEAL